MHAAGAEPQKLGRTLHKGRIEGFNGFDASVKASQFWLCRRLLIQNNLPALRSDGDAKLISNQVECLSIEFAMDFLGFHGGNVVGKPSGKTEAVTEGF